MIRDTPVVKTTREALAAEPSPEAQREHLAAIHNAAINEQLNNLRQVYADLREKYQDLTTHDYEAATAISTLTNRVNDLEQARRQADTDRYVAVRRELKAHCLADALMELVTTSGVGDDLTYRVAAAAALAASHESIWGTVLGIANQGRPDPFGKVKPDTIERVRTILAHRAGEA
jgi:chromosome segregation ATPase